MSARRWFRGAVFLTIWAALVFVFVRGLERDFATVTLWRQAVPVIAAAFLINLFVRSLYFRFLYRRSGLVLSVRESYLLLIVATAVNFVLPFKIGAAYRAVYLQRFHGFSLTRFAGTFLGFNFLMLFAATVFSLLGIAAVWLTTGAHSPLVAGLLGILFVALSAVAVGARFGDRAAARGWPGPLARLAPAAGEALRLAGDPRALGMSVGTTLVLSSVYAAMLYATFAIAGGPIAPAGAVSLALAQEIAGLLALTPGGAGVQELAGALFGGLLRIDTEFLLFVLVVIRFVRTLTVCIAAVPAHFLLGRRRP